jgi:hypothetical protein
MARIRLGRDGLVPGLDGAGRAAAAVVETAIVGAALGSGAGVNGRSGSGRMGVGSYMTGTLRMDGQIRAYWVQYNARV